MTATEANDCPICGEPIASSEVFGPGEGPNKSGQRVECYYHDDREMCCRPVGGENQ